jgi:predicted RNA binding protein YcfA (HicA-like mRNA interferase family)
VSIGQLNRTERYRVCVKTHAPLSFRGAAGDEESRKSLKCKKQIPRFARNDMLRNGFQTDSTVPRWLTPAGAMPMLLKGESSRCHSDARKGWYIVRTRGSHHQYRHPAKKGLVTVPGRGNDDLAPGTLNSIIKQAGLKQ